MPETDADKLAWLIKVGQVKDTKDATPTPTPMPTESETK